MKDLYIGNLPYTLNEEDIKKLFEPYGQVHKVTLIKDHQSGKKKGYGFVKLESDRIDKVIETLDRSECGGRTIRVGAAQSR